MFKAPPQVLPAVFVELCMYYINTHNNMYQVACVHASDIHIFYYTLLLHSLIMACLYQFCIDAAAPKVDLFLIPVFLACLRAYVSISDQKSINRRVFTPSPSFLFLQFLYIFASDCSFYDTDNMTCRIGAMTSIASSAVVFEGLFTDISRFHDAYLLLGLSWCLWCSSWSNKALPRPPQSMFLQDVSGLSLSLSLVGCV
ncbi:hypothetical protein V8B55DRAFT_1572436 [Mucor lusitanicus]